METFGRYQLVRRIAAGGMAEIFLATTVAVEGFEKQLIIKRMLPKWSREENFVAKFIDEARICSRLHHSNIVLVMDFGRHEDHYYLALEYLYGVDLAEVIKEARRRRIRVPDALAAYIIEQVSLGLDHAHDQKEPDGSPAGIVHRDISPGNVMLTFSGQVKVADFGIALATSRTSATEPGTIHGKVAYMSPEQARGEPLDRRTDIYSTGLMLYEMLAGVRAINAPQPKDLLRYAQRPRFAAVESHRDDLPPELADIVRLATHPDRDERYKTGHEFAEELQKYRAKTRSLESNHTLSRFLRDLFPNGPPEKKGAQAAVKATKVLGPDPVAAKEASAALERTEMSTAWERQAAVYLRRIIEEPNVWTLVELADQAKSRSLDHIARGLYRAAAAKLMQQGMVLSALVTFKALIEAGGTYGPHLEKEILELRRVKGKSNAELSALATVDDPLVDPVLSRLFFAHDDHRPPTVMPEPAVLLGLGDTEFLALLRVIRFRTAAAGTILVKQAAVGGSWFMLGKGRVVATARSKESRTQTVDSFAHGDVFGETAIFGQPSPISVLAFDDVEYFDVRCDDLNRLSADMPELRRRIEAIYRDRVADALLWQSPLFSVLSAKERKRLLQSAKLQTFAVGDTLVSEGDTSDAIYILRSGNVAAYEGDAAVRSFTTGEFFGEISALRRVARSHTVKATSAGEALVLDGGTLWKLARKNPDAQKHFDQAVEARLLDGGFPS